MSTMEFKRGDLVRHLYQKQFCTGIVLDVRHDPMDGSRVQVRFSERGTREAERAQRS